MSCAASCSIGCQQLVTAVLDANSSTAASLICSRLRSVKDAPAPLQPYPYLSCLLQPQIDQLAQSARFSTTT